LSDAFRKRDVGRGMGRFGFRQDDLGQVFFYFRGEIGKDQPAAGLFQGFLEVRKPSEGKRIELADAMAIQPQYTVLGSTQESGMFPGHPFGGELLGEFNGLRLHVPIDRSAVSAGYRGR